MLRWLKAVLEWTFGRGSFIQLSLQAPNYEGYRETGEADLTLVKARAILTVE